MFEVRDEGEGFDPSSNGHGTVQGIADRPGALDGTVEVLSSIGAGTSVTGPLPVSVEPTSREGVVV